MKLYILNKKLLFDSVFLFLILGFASCGGGEDPKPEETKLTGISLNLEGPKSKLDAVASFQQANGIGAAHTSTTTVTISAYSQYSGSLIIEETTGPIKTNAAIGYTTTYQIIGVDATVSSAGDTPTLTSRATGSGNLIVTATKAGKASSITFPLTVTN